ncbi:MAG TPA: hypothetical protein VGF55_18350 [Gemmataceae bacterium]|jgi:hypothetical protein
MAKSIRETFGLDYLINQTSPGPQGPQASAASVARPGDAAGAAGAGRAGTAEELKSQARLVSDMTQLLSLLNDRPGGEGRLHDLAGQTEMDLKQLLALVDVLTRYGLVEVVRPDKLGNDEIRLTDAGRQFLAP